MKSTLYESRKARKTWMDEISAVFMDQREWVNPCHILKDRFDALDHWDFLVEQTWAMWQGLACLLLVCLISGCASPEPRWLGAPVMSIPDQNGQFIQGYLPQIQFGIWRGKVYAREVPYTPPPPVPAPIQQPKASAVLNQTDAKVKGKMFKRGSQP